jgi:RNA polymerase sigma-70 factor (ECF subfamily)
MQPAVADAASRDDDIAELLRAGSRERAFETLVTRYEGKIYRLCFALLRHGAQAEDAAQESLVRIWKALDSYDGRASFSSWIYTITRNRCLTALERRKATDWLSDHELETEVAQTAATSRETPDEPAEQLRELVDRLPERLRRVLVLYYFEERSTNEVAAMLGCPEGTVKTHLFRARAALIEQLRKRGLNDPSIWLDVTT